ncbi:uncharacterized protein LOC119161551 isoform X1 [Rhipicephalus microplus]|uniref:uncharacterized protein LOC119161551 isoform X1 n=2 Tax=Rhipicephalus microplus TaxID=6941 RepID=UPI003F6B8467
MAVVVSASKVSRGCRERPLSSPATSCMRRQPDCGAATAAALSAPASRRTGGPNLGPGSMLAALSCRGPESKAPSSSPLAAGAAGPPSLAGGLTPMAHQPPAEERLLPNGNVCHFAGCGCADGVSGEIRAALKECVSNMRQQQQLQQQEQQLRQHHHGHQQQSGGLCGCPVLLRGACEHQARPASAASNNAASSQSAAPLKSLLKRASTTRPRRGSRVRFSDTLTVFSEDYPEAQLYVIRTAELTFAEVCAMYEPPPEYRDLPPFDPPDGYRDDAYLLPFLKEARAAAAAARAAAAAAASQQASQAGGIPAASAQVGAQQQQPQQQQSQQGSTVQHTPPAPTTTPVQIRVVERPPPPPPPPRTTPVVTGPPVVAAEDRGGSKLEDETQLLPPPTAEILEDLAKTAALEDAQRKGEKNTQKRDEEARIDQERPLVVADVRTTKAVVVVPPSDIDGGRPPPLPSENDLKKVIVADQEEDDEDVKQRDESSPVLPEDEDDAILLELKKQLECNSSGDIEADLAELLPPGLIVDDVSKKVVSDAVDDRKVVRHRPTVEVRPLSFRQPVPMATTPASPAATTPSTASSTPDDRQEDSDSSADSQDTIILMTNEEEKKAEEANEHRGIGGFRHKLLIIGDKSPSDTSSVSSSASQDSDGSMRSSESTTNSEDRTESPTGSSGSSSGGGGCGGRGHVVIEDDIYNDDLDALLEYGPHSNLQVRRTIERTAMRRSLTRVTDVRKRTPTNLAKSPTSSNDVSLVEKLRWLTSLDDDEDDGCSDDSEAAADHHHHHQGPPPPPPVARRPPPDPGFIQDAGRTLPGYPRGGLNGTFQPRPASFSQLSDACRGSLTMLPVAARDYRMVRRVPGENHPQQNTGVASQRAQPPPPPVRRPAPQGSGGVSGNSIAKDAPPDELERFVQQDMERTERIRKRYSLSEEDEDPSFGFARRPSVRGIRSRFGSSAELMKDVQQMMHHPAMNMPGSHLSWSHPVELPPPNHKTPQQVKVMLLPRVAEEDTGRNYGSAGDIATLTRSRRAFQPAPSPVPPSSSSLSAAKDERGVPEGACSSPKVSSEQGYLGQPPQQPKSGPVSAPSATPPSMGPAGTEAAPPPPPQGVVYYSLNV